MTNPDFDRRTVLKTIGVGTIGGTVLGGSATAQSEPPTGPPPFVPPLPLAAMWGSNGVDNWEFNDTGLRPSEAHAPFYAIQYLDESVLNGCHSPHITHTVDLDGDGEDEVIYADLSAPSPERHGGSQYNANWHVHFIPPGQGDEMPSTPTPTALEESNLTIIPLCWNEDFTGFTICGAPDSSSEPFIFTCTVKPKDCPE